MYIRKGARFIYIIWQERWSIVGLALLAFATELIDPYVPDAELFTVQYVAVLATALSIFLIFRFNESYERWWEARKLWGRLVNLSRDLGRQVLALYPEDGGREQKERLIYRQIAFPHVLRIRLREGSSPRGRTELEAVLRRLLPDETARLLAWDNVPAALLQGQSEQLAVRMRNSPSEAMMLTRFDTTLSGLVDVQGACERIKNTPFPDAVSLITRLLVWGLAVMLYMVTLGPDGRGGFAPTLTVTLMAMGFIYIDSMGRDLNDPFEGAPNDTPMTTLSLTIERDLREMLGESELPELPRPRRGVLL